MAKSVSTLRLVNLQSTTYNADQNFKANAHFVALNVLSRKNDLKN